MTSEQTQKTTLGYRLFRCSACKCRFNERTGTPFNFLHYPTDVVLLVVLWRLRYKWSLRDLSEMFLQWGIVFTHETIRDGETRFAPLVAEQWRLKRRGQAGRSWYVDETSIKVHGKWCSLSRAIDADGTLVDARRSEKRDREAAQRFFKQALEVCGHVPEQGTTDGHASSLRAVREILGHDVQHRTPTSLNNRLEQDHRGVKQRYSPMHGFGNVASAARFCHAFDEWRSSFRSRHTMGETRSLLEHRRLFGEKRAALHLLMRMAS